MIQDCTIVIPTHERASYLDMTLPFYAEFGCPLVIVDSSEGRYQGDVDAPHITYIHCPGEPFPHKLRRPIIDIDTPYIMLSADDSFTPRDAVAQCSDFLDGNPDYCSVHGYYFAVVQGDQTIAFMYDNNTEEIDVNGQTVSERLHQLYTPFNPNFYSVHRAGNWQETMRRYPDSITNYNLAEHFNAINTSLYGKHTVLPIFFNLQVIGPAVHNKSPRYRHSLAQVATWDEYRDQWKDFLSTTSAHLAERANITVDEAETTILEALRDRLTVKRERKTLIDRVRRELRQFARKTIHRRAAHKKKADETLRRKALFRHHFGRLTDRERDEVARLKQIMHEHGLLS